MVRTLYKTLKLHADASMRAEGPPSIGVKRPKHNTSKLSIVLKVYNCPLGAEGPT
jgi:hypothetical protein